MSPIGTPNDSEMHTDTSPASSDARAPQMTRASTSRPISSVPKRCAALGALRIALQLVCSGSYGATNGANSASRMKNTTTASPTIAPRRRTRRRNARWAGLNSRGGAAKTSTVSVAAVIDQPRIRGLTTK